MSDDPRFDQGTAAGSFAIPVTGRIDAYWDGGATSIAIDPSKPVHVGRDAACELVIGHDSVSRKHAVIRFDASGVAHVEDLGSRNGTRMGGRLLAKGESKKLVPGVAVEMGDAIVLVRGDDSDDSEPVPSRRPGVAEKSGPAKAMDRVDRLVRLVATSSISVILHGETGSGKEVFARRIHDASPRASSPFVAINCGALAEAILESELFGAEKGAFTGATAARVGLLESAQKGTVFLDEVGEMPHATQVKLLRAIEMREVMPVGATRPRAIDVRFVAASHKDLEALVDAGSFRADLFFRLNGITIDIPPLRERKDEIRALAERFGQGAKFTAAAFDELLAHDWPGNVRELRNVVERAVLLAEGGTVGPEHLVLRRTLPGSVPRVSLAPAPVTTSAAPAAEPGTDPGERQRIVDALAKCAGNQTKAAEFLGITRRALTYRMEVHKIPGPRTTRDP
ncbi:MAG: sigma 54-interacting transcriptional regulator [Polyangiaceae bacterium]